MWHKLLRAGRKQRRSHPLTINNIGDTKRVQWKKSTLVKRNRWCKQTNYSEEGWWECYKMVHVEVWRSGVCFFTPFKTCAVCTNMSITCVSSAIYLECENMPFRHRMMMNNMLFRDMHEQNSAAYPMICCLPSYMPPTHTNMD